MDMKLLETLVCPLCQGPVSWVKSQAELVCNKDKIAFPVRAGIPVMLSSEARQLMIDKPLDE